MLNAFLELNNAKSSLKTPDLALKMYQNGYHCKINSLQDLNQSYNFQCFKNTK